MEMSLLQPKVFDLIPLTSGDWNGVDVDVTEQSVPRNANGFANGADFIDITEGSGSLVLKLANAQTRTYNVAAGMRLNVMFTHIMSSSATSISACMVGFGSQIGGQAATSAGGISNAITNSSGSLSISQIRTAIISSSISGSAAASFKGTPFSLNGLENNFSVKVGFSAGSNIAGTGSIEVSNGDDNWAQVTSPTSTLTIFSGSVQSDNGSPMFVNFDSLNFLNARFRYDRTSGSGSISELWCGWRYF